MMRFTSVVLPAPVGPTIATVCPGSTRNDRSVMSGRSGVYENAHVLELDDAVAVDRLRGIGRVGLLLVCVEQLEDALGRGGARLHDRGHAAQLATAAG